MIKFKSALDTVQSEIAARERQGIKPIPVTRKTLYRQATVNTTSVTHSEPVTHTVNIGTHTERTSSVERTNGTHRTKSGTHSVTETGTHKADGTHKSVTDKPAKKLKPVDIVQSLNTHITETSAVLTKAEKQRAYRQANKDRYQAANRERMAAKRTK